ncbi:MAG TPA: FAD-binding oxidoreductase [Bacillota bacterium]|nr:FAD-binding oxidoreductase [Bacillota bacterium]
MSDLRPQIAHRARLIRNESLSAGTNVLTLAAPLLARTAQPGQFVQLKAEKYFLRRPIGVMSVDRERGRVQLGIRRVGKGSNDLCDLSVDYLLDVVGPLGHGFDLSFAEGKFSSAAEEKYSLITIGGGTGLFPLIFLLEEAKKTRMHTIALAGFKSPAEAILLERMQDTADQCVFSSESGGLDYSGHVGDAFAAVLKGAQISAASSNAQKNILVCACGPIAMLENIAFQCQKHKIPCQVSLEARMACGLGVCVGCSIPVYKAQSDEEAGCDDAGSETTYDRCCYDGPVFPAERIVWPSQGGVW